MKNLMYDAVIVGGGISGLTLASELSKSGLRPLIIDKGQSYDTRTNQLEGIGGAGTLGGGKLCHPPASGGIWKMTDTSLLPFMYRRYIYDYCPRGLEAASNTYEKRYPVSLLLEQEMHSLIDGLITEAKKQGTDIQTDATAISYRKVKNLKALLISDSNGNLSEVFTRNLVFACGRTSAMSIHRLLGSTPIYQQTPDLGIRLSMPREGSGALGIVGRDTKFKYWFGHTQVRTFCVCAGGEGVTVSLSGNKYYDGHFSSSITDVSNFGILARTPKIIGTKAAMDFLHDYQHFVEQDITLFDFLNDWKAFVVKPSYADVIYPIVQFLQAMLKSGTLTIDPHFVSVHLPSADRVNPLVAVNKHFETSDDGVFVIGDAAGLSRGYVQSMWSGYCAAQSILSQAGVSVAL